MGKPPIQSVYRGRFFSLSDAADRRSNQTNALGVQTEGSGSFVCTGNASRRHRRRFMNFFSLSFFFFAFVSSAESRECSFSSRQRDEQNQPRLSIMQGATPSPPIPNIIYFYNISRMFNLISSTYKSPRMNNAGAKQLHSGFASVIDISLLSST